EPLAHGAIRFRHLGDLREHGAFPVRLVRSRSGARGRLQLLDALLHRASFLVRESREILAGRGGALGGLLRALLCRFHGILFVFRAKYLSRVHSLRFNQLRCALVVGTARIRQSQHSPWDSNPSAFEPFLLEPFASQYGMQGSLNILSVSLPAFHCSEDNHGKIMSCHPFPTTSPLKPYPLIGWTP